MPYQINWHDKNILLIELEGEISGEELGIIAEESFQLVVAASQVIHAIVDTSKMTTSPLNLRKSVSSIEGRRHPNQGLTVMVIPKMNIILSYASTTIMQLLRLEFRIVRSIEEAEATIHRIDPQFAP